jgi:soluble lytic murein transglycosylase-like protein
LSSHKRNKTTRSYWKNLNLEDSMICQLVIATALKYALPPLLFAAIIHQESSFNPKAVNSTAPVASYGIGQLTKATAAHHCKMDESELLDLEKNLECSAKVLAYQFKRYKGDFDKTMSAYNAGTYTLKNTEYVRLVRMRMGQNYCLIKGDV